VGRRASRAVVTACLIVFLCAALALLCSSCGREDPAAGAPGSEAGHFVQSHGGVTADLKVDGYPPLPMRKATFSLALSDKEGVALVGATVLCDMTMPEMEMPLNRPELGETQPGVYSAEVLFTMAGKWQAALEVTLSDGRTRTFTFAMSTR
jgi:hypothetical protein